MSARVGYRRRKVRAYICAPLLKVKEARSVAVSISKAKHIVTSGWLKHSYGNKSKINQIWAMSDIFDILRAEVVVVLAYLGSDSKMGFEVGYALAKDMPIVVVGSREEIWQYHVPDTQVYETWVECRDKIFPIPKYVQERRIIQVRRLLASKRRHIQQRWKDKEALRLKELDDLERMSVRE